MRDTIKVVSCPTLNTMLLKQAKSKSFNEIHTSKLSSRAKFYIPEIINTKITATSIRNYLYTSQHPAIV